MKKHKEGDLIHAIEQSLAEPVRTSAYYGGEVNWLLFIYFEFKLLLL